MSIIQFRVHEVSEKLDKYLLADVFHLGNFRISQFATTIDRWWLFSELDVNIEQDYFEPVDPDEICAEYIRGENDGFIVHLEHPINKRSYAKANGWLKNIHEGHIELIRDMGWECSLYIGRNPQGWISKKFIRTSDELNVPIVSETHEAPVSGS